MMFEEYLSYFGYYCTELCVFGDFPLLSFAFFDLIIQQIFARMIVSLLPSVLSVVLYDLSI